MLEKPKLCLYKLIDSFGIVKVIKVLEFMYLI